jgi:hypothetical protein
MVKNDHDENLGSMDPSLGPQSCFTNIAIEKTQTVTTTIAIEGFEAADGMYKVCNFNLIDDRSLSLSVPNQYHVRTLQFLKRT